MYGLNKQSDAINRGIGDISPGWSHAFVQDEMEQVRLHCSGICDCPQHFQSEVVIEYNYSNSPINIPPLTSLGQLLNFVHISAKTVRFSFLKKSLEGCNVLHSLAALLEGLSQHPVCLLENLLCVILAKEIRKGKPFYLQSNNATFDPRGPVIGPFFLLSLRPLLLEQSGRGIYEYLGRI